MRITAVESWGEDVPLTRPYTIARKTTSAVRLFFVRLEDAAGHVGFGSASPSKDVTGETAEACAAALESARELFLGCDARHLGENLAVTRELRAAPAARAALDVALFDLHARGLGVPLVDLLGQRCAPLPTSITIGIRPLDETLAEAREYRQRGFNCLKLKIGRALHEDMERLTRVREEVGPAVRLRVDANEGYRYEEALRLGELVEALDLELVEQPLPRGAEGDLRRLPDALRARVAADESAQSEADVLRLCAAPAACATFVIKLMKCGGIASALRIAAIAEAADKSLMWGCMDESVVSIAAALHAALASPATRYLDLDGSFDLAADPMQGGFALEGGVLIPLDVPGLGVRPRGT